MQCRLILQLIWNLSFQVRLYFSVASITFYSFIHFVISFHFFSGLSLSKSIIVLFFLPQSLSLHISVLSWCLGCVWFIKWCVCFFFLGLYLVWFMVSSVFFFWLHDVKVVFFLQHFDNVFPRWFVKLYDSSFSTWSIALFSLLHHVFFLFYFSLP